MFCMLASAVIIIIEIKTDSLTVECMRSQYIVSGIRLSIRHHIEARSLDVVEFHSVMRHATSM